MTNLPINGAADALQVGQFIARSGAFGVNSDEAGAVVALMCYQEGISLLSFLRTYHIVDNKPSMRADAMMAKFMELGGDFELIERSDKRAAIKIWREGGKPQEFALTMEQVQAAGYCFGKDGKTLRGTWRQHTKAMLWARLISDAIRALDPRVNAGTYTPEEEEDMRHHEARADPRPTEPTPLGKAPPPVAPPQATPPPPATDDPFADEEPASEFDLVPAGKFAGKRWTELTHETLTKMVNNPGPLSPEHLERAKAALEKTPF